MVADKTERMYQIYEWLKTSRLSDLYYEESLRRWSWGVKMHDVIIALTGAASPIAFWQHSSSPIQQQGWFWITLVAATFAMLKPILRWENNLRLYSELHVHYSDLYMDLKCLCEDIAASNELSTKANSLFEHYRRTFRSLEHKEPPQNDQKVRRLQIRVNREIDINKCWFPNESE